MDFGAHDDLGTAVGEDTPTYKTIDKYQRTLAIVGQEVADAITKFPNFRSPHEGVAIIEEEFLELREEAFWGLKSAMAEMEEARRRGLPVGDPTGLNRSRMRKEAIQVAAMAVRFATEIV